jgi:hypothetical protein
VCLLLDTADSGSGSTHFSAATFRSNLPSSYIPFPGHSTNSFWVMFNIFFPGFTGVLGGFKCSPHSHTGTQAHSHTVTQSLCTANNDV